MRESEILSAEPSELSDDDLDLALGQAVRVHRKLRDDRTGVRTLNTKLGDRVTAMRDKIAAFRAEKRSR